MTEEGGQRVKKKRDIYARIQHEITARHAASPTWMKRFEVLLVIPGDISVNGSQLRNQSILLHGIGHFVDEETSSLITPSEPSFLYLLEEGEYLWVDPLWLPLNREIYTGRTSTPNASPKVIVVMVTLVAEA